MTSNGPPPHEQANSCISDSSSDKVSSSTEEDSSEDADRRDSLTVTTAVDGDVMKILSCSTDFACTFGPSVCGENLADWVLHSQRKSFKRWVEESANKAFWASRECTKFSPARAFRSLTFQSAHIACKADCAVDHVSLDQGQGSEHTFKVTLCITNLAELNAHRAETSSSSSSHDQATCGSSSPRTEDQSRNSEHSGSQQSDVDEITSSLEAVINVQSLPMRVVSCSAALVVGSDMGTIESIIPEQYVNVFTTWLSNQVRLGRLHLCAEKSDTLKLELTDKGWFKCSIGSTFPQPECHVQDIPLELPVKVKFHPLHAPNIASVACLPTTSSSSSSSGSFTRPSPKVCKVVQL